MNEAELSTKWLLLNCLTAVLNAAELSQAPAKLYSCKNTFAIKKGAPMKLQVTE